jgi:hypothetical protein
MTEERARAIEQAARLTLKPEALRNLRNLSAAHVAMDRNRDLEMLLKFYDNVKAAAK